MVTCVIYINASSAFISSEELKSRTGTKLVLLDTTDVKTYKKGHIPGALNVDATKFRRHVGTYMLMKAPREIEELARSLGINNDSEVVIYGHNKGKELLKASYIALALSTNGLKNISILDGGYPDWLSEYEFDGLISQQAAVPKRGDFTAKYNDKILVDLEYVKSHIGVTPMMEARPLKYYNGSEQSVGVKRLGHISKAQSSYWREKFDEAYKVKSDKVLDDIFIKNHKLDKNKEVILYCTGGLEASMNWYLLHQSMGFENVKVYDASMREWGNRDDTPMEK